MKIIKKNILIVSQLALGDAYILEKYIASPLRDRGFNVTILCNNFNKFIFNKFDVIVEDWPLSKRRFKSIFQFLLLFKNLKIKKESIIIIPSGHFIEKFFASIKFRRNLIYCAKIMNGLRADLNNQIIGNYVDFKNQIKILSFDSYGGHVEFLAKFLKIVDSDFEYIRYLEDPLNIFIKPNSFNKIFIQISSTASNKSMPISFIKDLLRYLKNYNGQIYIISDKFCDISDNSFYIKINPKSYINILDSNSLVFLLDSYLLHYSSGRCHKIYAFVSRKYAYDWHPYDATPISSIYSLSYRS